MQHQVRLRSEVGRVEDDVERELREVPNGSSRSSLDSSVQIGDENGREELRGTFFLFQAVTISDIVAILDRDVGSIHPFRVKEIP